MVFLTLDLDIFPGPEVDLDPYHKEKRNPILLSMLLEMALNGTTATGATELRIQQI